MNIYYSLEELPVFENTIVSIGSFDGVHLGHQKLISRARTLARELSLTDVLVTFHPHPRSIIYPKDQSLQLLSSVDEKIDHFKSFGVSNLVIVPFTFEFSQLSPREYVERFLIKCFTPHTIIIGYDHKFGFNRQGDIYLLKEYEKQGSFKVLEIPKQEVDEIAVSSTKIRNALLEGNIADANLYLNHYYPIIGKVVKGDSIGEKIGYPTANIVSDIKNKLIPNNGVYAVYTWIDSKRYEGMLYIGTRPTIGDKLAKTIEVNIFDFEGSLYHDRLKIEIVEYLRSDQKFDSLEDLKKQLLIDKSDTKLALAKADAYKISKPKCTIAILNYNGEEHLEAYLSSVLGSSNKYDFEILVIDNNSTDDSLSYISEWHPEVKVLELSKNYGFAEGYNRGIVDVKTEYLALLNSDVLVTEPWLDNIIDFMDANPHVSAMSPKIRSLEAKSHFEYAGAAGGFLDLLAYPFCRGRIFDTVEEDINQYDDWTEVFWTSGAAMVVKTEVFNKFKGFDGSFFAHMEEIDFCWRTKKAGFSCFVDGSSFVYHLGGGTLSYDSPRKVYLNFRNNLLMILKNESTRFVLFTFFLRLILDGLAGIKFLFEGKWQNTLSIIKAHFAIYLNIFTIIETRINIYEIVGKNRIGKRNLRGRFYRFLVLDYFVGGLKYFHQLKKNYL